MILATAASLVAQTAVSQRPNRITQEIDSTRLVPLHGNVRRDLTAARDLGAVEDGMPLRLYLVLQRTPEQQVELDNLLARQQQPTAPEYHRWLTPQEYGERFGVSAADITGYSGTMRALPDISGFAADAVWGHALVFCDSYWEMGAPCYSLNTFGEAGGNANSLAVAYPSAPGYDEVTGIGTVNVYNLITNWNGNKQLTSTTTLAAAPTTIASNQSATLTAAVLTGSTPAASGSVSFAAASTALGNCRLSGGSCSLPVSGSALQPGSNSITATFLDNRGYPASTSSIVTVSVTGALPAVSLSPSSLALAGRQYVPRPRRKPSQSPQAGTSPAPGNWAQER
jgi:hypothetical protein